MERLTKRNEDGSVSLAINCPTCRKYFTCSMEEGQVCYHECEADYMCKLAEYEDAEEQGLLVKLPCKVGDKAWYVHKHGVDEVEIDSFIININIFANVSLYIGSERFGKTLTPFKTLFFNKEDAVKAFDKLNI